MRILLVEDEHKIANALKKGLEQESFAVDVTYNGDDGLIEATNEEHDLIILDRMIPGDVNGVGILKELRMSNNHTPVLFLTALGSTEDKVDGLSLGADDYLVKPFAFEELLARVRALLRRPLQSLQTVLECDDLSLNTSSYEIVRSNTQINLSAKEFALLEYLLRNQNRILSKSQIMQHVWDYDSDILPNTIEAYIGYLRKKIDAPFPKANPLIHTIRGFGYKFGVKK